MGLSEQDQVLGQNVSQRRTSNILKRDSEIYEKLQGPISLVEIHHIFEIMLESVWHEELMTDSKFIEENQSITWYIGYPELIRRDLARIVEYFSNWKNKIRRIEGAKKWEAMEQAAEFDQGIALITALKDSISIDYELEKIRKKDRVKCPLCQKYHTAEFELTTKKIPRGRILLGGDPEVEFRFHFLADKVFSETVKIYGYIQSYIEEKEFDKFFSLKEKYHDILGSSGEFPKFLEKFLEILGRYQLIYKDKTSTLRFLNKVLKQRQEELEKTVEAEDMGVSGVKKQVEDLVENEEISTEQIPLPKSDPADLESVVDDALQKESESKKIGRNKNSKLRKRGK